jgi:hypothetical protein
LSALDTASVKYVVWQYCANDEDENRAWITNKGSLPPHRPESLDSVMRLHKWTRKYFPGRHFFTIAKLAVAEYWQELHETGTANSADPAHELQKARDFLDIATKSAIDFSRTKLVVMDLGPYPLSGGFIQAVKELVEQRGLKNNFILIDCSTVVGKDDFYTLDVHLNKTGNQKIANALQKALDLP